jgi:putative aminopeptidase
LVSIPALMEEFMLTVAVSGHEGKMARKLKAKLEPFSDEVFIDKVGNTIARIDGSDDTAPSMMVYAHVDQLGFIVRKIEPNGLIQVDRLGGIPEKVLPALNVLVSTLDGEPVPGIITIKAHHATPPEEKYKVDVVTDLFIDIGATSREEVLEAGVRIGRPVCYKPSFTRLMGSFVSGTAVDDRGGCAALVRIAEILSADRPRATTYIVGSVWEEYNLRGAIFAARRVKPEMAICIDVALSGDTPDLAKRYDVALSQGPTVTLYNFHGRGTLNGAIAHDGLYRLAMRCAKETGINLQDFAALGMLTDNAYLQLEGLYTPCLDMGFPARYTHSPIEMCDTKDLEELSDLIASMVSHVESGFALERLSSE